MSRLNEIKCLEKLISSYFNNDGLKIDFDNSDSYSTKVFLSSLKENKDNNKFPDFVFDEGIAEHFLVSSSNETRKGSSYKIEENINKEKAKEGFAKADEDFKSSPYSPNTFSIAKSYEEYEGFSYNNFCDSFKKNFIRHYNSLIKSPYTNKTVAFLIEQQDSRLSIWKNDVCLRFYCLSEDKNLLLFLKAYSNEIRYIFFVQIDGIEIIDLKGIDQLLEKSKDDLDIRGGQSKHITLKLYIDLPN